MLKTAFITQLRIIAEKIRLISATEMRFAKKKRCALPLKNADKQRNAGEYPPAFGLYFKIIANGFKHHVFGANVIKSRLAFHNGCNGGGDVKTCHFRKGFNRFFLILRNLAADSFKNTVGELEGACG